MPAALAVLDDGAADTLRLYYQAAIYLRSEADPELRQFSDDTADLLGFFWADLGLPVPGALPVAEALRALGSRHAGLTGLAYNWAGSYRQHLPLFLRQLRRSHAPFTV